MTTREMKAKGTLYVRKLRADAEGLLEQANQLEKNCFEDSVDLKLIDDQLPYVEEIGAEVGELREDMGVLAQELRDYISPDLTDAERREFGF